MDNDILTVESTPNDEPRKPEGKRRRPHLIGPAWIRIPLKTLAWLLLVVLCIPVLLYIPPIQTFIKDVACRVVADKTGMKVSIGTFRLQFPLDVALDDVTVVEAGGDTMVRARSAIVDVRLRPLFDKEIKLKALRLVKGYYRMVAADSSMIMTVDAGLLDVDSRSSFDLSPMKLDLNRARLRDGTVSLYMDVWKKKPTPPDSVKPTSPFLIKAADLRLENIGFAMSMLPTIDTLTLRADDMRLKDAIIDLGNNNIHASFLGGEKGRFTYLTPTAEYIRKHPAPIDTITPPSPPMTISADSVALDGFDVFYGVKGARPQPGFDASAIDLTGVNISLADFYNRASEIRVPIRRLMAKERCGLQILSGSGLFTLDSVGIRLQDMELHTPHTTLLATAAIPFAVMEMNRHTPMSLEAKGDIGFADVTAFMPTLRTYTSSLSPAHSLLLNLDAAGTLDALRINTLKAQLPGVLDLRASGRLEKPMVPTQMGGNLAFHASLTAPQVAQRLTGIKDVNIPSFTLDGTASVAAHRYTFDFTMASSAGNLAADGSVSLTAESYDADVDIHNLNVGHIVPSLGVGTVTARLSAHGDGFDPTRRGADTDVRLDVARADYGGHSYSGITGTVNLHNGIYDVDLASSDPDAELSVKGTGSIAPDLYTVDLQANISYLDLEALKLSTTPSHGHGNIYVKGTASPDRWLYDMELQANNVGWTMPDMELVLPAGIAATLLATDESVACHLSSDGTDMDFSSECSLRALTDKLTVAASAMQKQIEGKNLDMEALQKYLPPFTLSLNADGNGLARQLIANQGITIDSINAGIVNADSLLTGRIGVTTLATSSITLDTLTLDLNQRGSMMDYALHLGNRAPNLPEFAKVELNGYAGGNRLSAFLRQYNDKGETGYRLGFTAAMMDSTVTVHFTPLKATIAYMPWTFNLDNHVDYNMLNHQVDANLMASSLESSILLRTRLDDEGDNTVNMQLSNIKVQDFLSMAVNAPPVKATVNAEVDLKYKGMAFAGNGRVDVAGLEYDRQQMGDFALGVKANLDMNGHTEATASLLIDEKEVMNLQGIIKNDGSADPNDFILNLTQFPLRLANPFIGKDVAQLEGVLNGQMRMDGELTKPLLNGQLTFDKAAVYIPMMASKIHLNSEPIDMIDNIVRFDDFSITGQNDNPLTIDGTVDMNKLSAIMLDMKLAASDFQLLNNDRRSRAELYGKLFMNMNATVAGPLSLLDINGALTVLGTSDVTYSMQTATNSLQQQQQSDVVRFVNFSDTTQVAKEDSIAPSMTMRVRAALTIQPGTSVTVGLPPTGSSNKVQLSPSGTLNYFQNFMGDMRLNGQLMLGNGMARYSLPVVGEKNFTLGDQSYVQWNGPVMNPGLNIHAFDNMKVNVSDQGNARVVNFIVSLDVTNNLDNPRVMFDLEAEGDMTIQNELQAMTAEQRSNQAMNLLLYGQYSGPNTKTISSANLAESAVYSFLTSQINNWAANNIRGVDLSFGVNQYDLSANGENQQTTSYSYQVSKSLFNNRFKIVVGGNYSTDANADENFAQNLLSDVSFEYMLKQTNSLSMLVKLFRHADYESVLEGEVTETGVGFVMKRRMENLKRFFRVRWGKRKPRTQTPTDTTSTTKQ